MPVCIAVLAALVPSDALAHASDRGHVLLLPTGYYVTGGAIAVGGSFLALTLLPARGLERAAAWRLQLGTIPDGARIATSLMGFAAMLWLVAAGLLGSRDPLSNPLPLAIWTLLWVGLTLAQGLFGNLWAWFNPWYGPCRLVSALMPGLRPLPCPSWLGTWPAALLFAGFAWFELIYPAPDDPGRLALAVWLYWMASFTFMLLFGCREWSRRGEFLSVFFAMVSRFAVLQATSARGRTRICLCLPGAALREAPTLSPSATLFLLMTLGSVSFDGLSKTFFWLGLNGVNPLEFPGRSALIAINSLGLFGTIAALAALYLAAVAIGERLAGSKDGFAKSAGLLVWSIVPISLAYHFSHYLTALLVNGQYALVALSDPFGRGWDLLGIAHMQVGAGIVMGSQAAWWIWNVQAAAIIGGHLMAVAVAHALAHRLHDEPRKVALSQLPLTVLMVGYTMFGLWLLSTPTAG